MGMVTWSFLDSLGSISLPARDHPNPVAERDHGDNDLRGAKEPERERRIDEPHEAGDLDVFQRELGT